MAKRGRPSKANKAGMIVGNPEAGLHKAMESVQRAKPKLQLLEDRVLLEVDKRDEKSASGLLYLPKTAQPQRELLLRARVLAVGPGAYHHDSTCFISMEQSGVHVGDRVLYDKHAGVPQEHAVIEKYLDQPVDPECFYMILRVKSVAAVLGE